MGDEIPPEFIHNAIAEENGFFVNKMFTVPSNNGTANIHLRNPHSDKLLWIESVDMEAVNSQNFHLYDSFNSITPGTELTIQNALMDENGGAPDSGPFEAYKDSTFDATNGGYPIGFTMTDHRSSTGSQISAQAVAPSREVVFEFENLGANNNKAFISIFMLSSY